MYESWYISHPENNWHLIICTSLIQGLIGCPLTDLNNQLKLLLLQPVVFSTAPRLVQL